MAEELDTVRRLAAIVGPAPAGQVWIGDDAAVVPGPEGSDLLVAADVVVAGVHFDRRFASLADVAWKAVAVNVSDIAAMGGQPRYVLATIAAPDGTDVDTLLAAMVEAARARGTELIGGDLSSGADLSLSVTILGTVQSGGAVLRAGARAGDTVFVTGPLGSAAAGLELLRRGPHDPSDSGAGLVAAHLRPVPRVAEGRAAAEAGATSMIDVSDGLAVDCWRVAEASGLAIELDTVPVAPEVAGVVDDADAVALGGGDDYELVFTAPDPRQVRAVFARLGLSEPLEIGRCAPGEAGLTLRGVAVPRSGWTHRW